MTNPDEHENTAGKPGGVAILFHPVPWEFHQIHHPSYIDFFEEVLRDSTDPATIESKHEERYATDPWYIHLYRTSHAYHGVHPFYMWYWGAHGRDHCGDVIFVGGSLVPVGGHNVIEPALFGKPVVFGPHMQNFRDAAGLLTRAGGGIQVPDGGAALVGALRALLVDEADRRVRGEAAWRAVSLHQGACQRTVDALAGLLEGRA